MTSVPNHDWAKVLTEPTTETIDRCLQDSNFVKALLQRLTEKQTAALHWSVRKAIAAEMLKLEHSYSSRPGGLVAPANVAYHLAERGREIADWTPSWCVVTTYVDEDGVEEEQPFDDLTEAKLDCVTIPPRTTKKLRMR